MKKGGSEIKRDMEQGNDEVRLMTVHGAKGLEANIVFLPDSCSNRSSTKSGSVLAIPATKSPPGTPAPLLWAVPGASEVQQVADARAARRHGDIEEYNRLLYVAMTRARDRLYICGYEGARKRDTGCWYDLIMAGLEDLATQGKDHDGQDILRIEGTQQVPPDREYGGQGKRQQVSALPGWAIEDADGEDEAVLHVTPSSILPPQLADDRRDMDDFDSVSPLDASERDLAILRGTLTHALLEHLPDIEPAGWSLAAQNILSIAREQLSSKTRQEILKEVVAILREKQFAFLFGKNSRAEVPVLLEMPAKGKTAPVQMSGEIDRLVVMPERIFIVDYKSNREVPQGVDQVPPAYVAQLAAYRLAIGKIYRGKDIICGLLWTRGARLMWLDNEVVEQNQGKLARYFRSGLDAATLDT